MRAESARADTVVTKLTMRGSPNPFSHLRFVASKFSRIVIDAPCAGAFL
jgi:hypothetical protein